MAELVVALDFPTREEALAAAGRLAGQVAWVKVGIELFTAAGPDVVVRLKEQGFQVFLDLKLFDIPNTVRGAVRAAAGLGADMVSIHVLGGERMAEAAREGRVQGTAAGRRPPLLLGVTLLTSQDLAEAHFFRTSAPGDLVLDLARAARRYYLDGVVCSGLELAEVKAACGPGFGCLVPGVRPEGQQVPGDDQRRVVSPARAVELGADFLVVGRSITRAVSPADAARTVLGQMRPPKAAEEGR
jgi:orotidine-5'-phosphate decarboxylase